MDAQRLRRLGRRLVALADEASLGPASGASIDAALAGALDGDDPRVEAEVRAVLDVLAHWLLGPTGDDADALPGLEGGFDVMYRDGVPPWDIGRPQAAFEQLAADGAISGRVLDVGCGTGEHALLAASLGLEAVGVDLSPTAIDRARRKAAERHVPAAFEVLDVVDVADLGGMFDTVLDCGLVHTLPDDVLEAFVAAIGAVVPAGGTYHLLCASDRQPGHAGPRRMRHEDIHDAFADGWRVDAIDETELETTTGQGALAAWHARIVRI